MEPTRRWAATARGSFGRRGPDMAGVIGRSNREAQSGETRNMPLVVARMRRSCSLFLVAFSLVACRSTSQSPPSVPRYLVTSSPIDVGLGPWGLCVAVDPLDQHGVWWWEPGASGCASRSTGPGVFHAEEATVSQSTQTGPTAVSFRLSTHSATRPFIDVRLVVENGDMRALESGARVALQRRNDLGVPEIPGRGRLPSNRAPDGRGSDGGRLNGRMAHSWVAP